MNTIESSTNKILAQLDERLIYLMSAEQLVPSIQELLREDPNMATSEAVIVDAVVNRLRPTIRRGLDNIRKGILSDLKVQINAIMTHATAIEGIRYELHQLRNVWPELVEESKKREELV